MINKIWSKMTSYSPTTYFAISLIAKDAVGCWVYTSTAKNNKRYTPEKRSDVANYDLANGIINIALQILAIKPIEAGITKLSESKFIKHLYTNLDEKLGSSDNAIVKKALKHKSGIVKGTTALLSIAICQYIIKRFVSPFFSMPAGQKFQEMGLIKPKIYPGETYDLNNKKQKLNVVDSQKNIAEDKTKEKHKLDKNIA